MKEKPNRSLTDVYADGKKYLQNRIEFAELNVLNRSTRVIANMLTEAAQIIFFLIAFLFGTIALGFYLSDLLRSHTLGFGAVALIYALLSFFIYLTKDKYIERVIIDRIIKKYYEGENEN